MKKFFFAAALLSLALPGLAEARQALTLHLQPEGEIVYYLDSEPSIGFRDQDMIVTAQGQSRSIPMAEVARWEIGWLEQTGLETSQATETMRISIDGNSVTVANPQSREVVVYSLSGQCAGQSRQTPAAFTLPAGIYLIRIDNKSYKIAVR